MSQIIRVENIPNKGRGVVANVNIAQNCLIEETQILIFSKQAANSTGLINYCFPYDYTETGQYDPGVDSVCIGLGSPSLLNCSADANTTWEVDPTNKVLRIFAKRFIAQDEEVTLDYGLTEEQMLERGWTP